ncbi:MAG: beta-L-arabinofuranosidase domain-containing protein, partial [Ferruginibacter sp.]
WQDIVTHRLYITGTASSHEYFQEDEILPAGSTDNMGEGCVTTTWIQLNQNLFAITGDIKYLNQLEKSVYNHLLAAENPETGCVSYYTPLMNKKPYTCYITCCQSSVPRGIALVPNFTFGNINNIPTVLFYEPAVYKDKIITLDKKNMDVVFTLDGNFPESGNFVLSVTGAKAAIFPIALRVPDWCTNYTATVGGKIYKGTADQFVTINKNWSPGEKIMISFDMPITMIAGGKVIPIKLHFSVALKFWQWINA